MVIGRDSGIVFTKMAGWFMNGAPLIESSNLAVEKTNTSCPSALSVRYRTRLKPGYRKMDQAVCAIHE
jgi:hypothetical protein